MESYHLTDPRVEKFKHFYSSAQVGDRMPIPPPIPGLPSLSELRVVEASEKEIVAQVVSDGIIVATVKFYPQDGRMISEVL